MVWMEETRGKREEIVLEAIEKRVEAEEVGGPVARVLVRVWVPVDVF
jgi:hypothetical protein